MEKKIITILDLSSEEVHVYSYPADVDDVEVWVEENTPHKLNGCQWMCTEELCLQIHPSNL
jgi:hypothetical protein